MLLSGSQNLTHAHDMSGSPAAKRLRIAKIDMSAAAGIEQYLMSADAHILPTDTKRIELLQQQYTRLTKSIDEVKASIDVVNASVSELQASLSMLCEEQVAVGIRLKNLPTTPFSKLPGQIPSPVQVMSKRSILTEDKVQSVLKRYKWLETYIDNIVHYVMGWIEDAGKQRDDVLKVGFLWFGMSYLVQYLSLRESDFADPKNDKDAHAELEGVLDACLNIALKYDGGIERSDMTVEERGYERHVLDILRWRVCINTPFEIMCHVAEKHISDHLQLSDTLRELYRIGINKMALTAIHCITFFDGLTLAAAALVGAIVIQDDKFHSTLHAFEQPISTVTNIVCSILNVEHKKVDETRIELVEDYIVGPHYAN